MAKVPRGYRKLDGSERTVRKGATRERLADPEETLVVSIYVRPRADAPPLLDQGYFAATPLGRRQLLTRAEFAVRHGASPEDLQAVTDFAAASELEVVQTDAARRLVQVSGTVAQFSKAFAIDLAVYRSSEESYRGGEGPIHLPNALADVVEGVFGLDNRRMARRMSNGGGAAVPLTPPQVAKAYNFPAPPNGAAGQTIAVLEFGAQVGKGGGFAQSDIDGFISHLNATTGSDLTSTTVTVVPVDAQNAPAGSVTNFRSDDPDIEIALDLEVAVSVAQHANIVAYFTGNCEQGWVDALTQIVADTTNDPGVLSISAGWTELETAAPAVTSSLNPQQFPWPFEWTAQAFSKMTEAFQAAANINMTVLAAAGDNGSDCGERDGFAHVQYPASDPWVISCGGTIINTLSPLSENTWNDNSIMGGEGVTNGLGATGGGISYLADPVAWQANANMQPSVNPDHHFGRGLPDVAGNASPKSGYDLWLYGQPLSSLVYTSGELATESAGAQGGTSAVAPLYAGLFALINASLNLHVGYLNPQLYNLGPATSLGPSPVFRDIKDGISNSVVWDNQEGFPDIGGPSPGYASGLGWDACTGWGSIDGSALLSALAAEFAQIGISFYMEQTTFSQDEVELQLPRLANFAAGWIAADGFRPDQLLLNSGNLDTPPIASILNITFAPDPSLPTTVQSAIQGMLQPTFTGAGAVLPQDPSLPDLAQRFLFPFLVQFNGDSGFQAMLSAPAPIKSADITLSATLTVAREPDYSNQAQIELTTGEDPRFEDVNPADPTQYPSWLSFDLRLFTVTVERTRVPRAPAQPPTNTAPPSRARRTPLPSSPR